MVDEIEVTENKKTCLADKIGFSEGKNVREMKQEQWTGNFSKEKQEEYKKFKKTFQKHEEDDY